MATNFTSINYYWKLFGVSLSEYMPAVELCSVKVICLELDHGAIVWCIIITQANDQNQKAMSTLTLDLYSVNRTDIDSSLAMSDAIIKGKKNTLEPLM